MRIKEKRSGGNNIFAFGQETDFSGVLLQEKKH